MSTSQNGWPAHETSTDLVPLRWVTGRVVAGDVHTVLDHVARRFDADVEPVDTASSWGWAHREISGVKDLSNHASGTAIDLNAPRHGLGRRDTFTPAQVASIRRILADVAPVVRWGGDYAGRADEMHFEIVGTAAQVAAVAARLRGGGSSAARPSTPTTSEEDDMIYLRVIDGTRPGDVYECGELSVDKLSAQSYEDLKTTIAPRMKDATQAAVDRLAARVAARRTHIFGPDKKGR